MIIDVLIVHEERNDNAFLEMGVDPEIIEYLEEGLIDLRQVVAISAYHEHTQLFLTGGHSLIIDEDFYTFASRWKKMR